MIYINASIQIPDEELKENFIRSSRPGGQNVNKVATAVQLRFDMHRSEVLSEEVKQRLKRLAGRRMTAEGVLVIDARRYRDQERNRQDARERLAALIRRAVEPTKPRRKTHPTRASLQRRLEEKKRRGETKRERAKPSCEDYKHPYS